MTSTTALRIAAVFGFLAVAIGAFGAHGLKSTLATHGTMETWKTASLYHLVHAVALLVVAHRTLVPRLTVWLFSLGIVVFSGTLYVLALTGLTWLGAVAPLGGLAFLAGWLSLWRAR